MFNISGIRRVLSGPGKVSRGFASCDFQSQNGQELTNFIGGVIAHSYKVVVDVRCNSDTGNAS